jgi:hypothetical protein
VDGFRKAVACETAPASQRFRAARTWASHAASKHDSSLDAYHAAIALLPRLAMLSLNLSSRQQAVVTAWLGPLLLVQLNRVSLRER